MKKRLLTFLQKRSSRHLLGYLFLSITCSGLLLQPNVSYAQEDSTANDEEFYDLSLEDLLNMEVSIASRKALTQRESPGIVSVISKEEIMNAGARDLIDVLRLVPGFTFGTDVEGSVGLGIRGNWAHEGKVLLLIDGLEANENLFSTTQFGNHYDVSQIERIEIIRGPGSSVYGGYAELGVINIITKQGKDLNGVQVSGTYGQLSDTYARRNASVSVGQEVNEDFSYSLSAFYGQGQRSNQTFTDIYGDEAPMTGGSNLDPTMVNLGLKYKGLSFRTVYDHYKTNTWAVFDAIGDETTDVNFESLMSELKYEVELNDKMKLIPKINYTKQLPWASFGEDRRAYYSDNEFYYQITAEKMAGNLTFSYNPTEKIDITAGTEYFIETGENKDTAATPYFINDKDKISFNTFSGFVQAVASSDIANVTIGGRYNNHNQFGAAFSPRLGITKVKDNFHAKLLFTNAFRAPGIENINLNENIRPEKTTVVEFEVGYKITDNMIVQANAYDITINGPIVYFYDEDTEEEGYDNFNQSGSRGVEFEAKYKDKWGYVNLNYAFFTTAGKNDVSYYEVTSDPNTVLGFPQHRVNLYGSVKLMEGLSVNPSLTFMTDRYGFEAVDTTETSILTTFDPVTLVNLNIRYKKKGFEANVGVYDLLDQQFRFVQPYDGYYSPLPGPGREIVARLSYKLGFKKKSEPQIFGE